MNDATLSSSAQRVQSALAAAGLDCVVTEYAVSARTSEEAAAVLGCPVGAIAKSLIFRAGEDDAVLVIASGANRVDESKLAVLVGQRIGKADAAFVRRVTGYAIGGIPPLAPQSACKVIIDRELLQYDCLFAAGGTPHAMFPIRPMDLMRISGGSLAEVALRDERTGRNDHV
jgi:prolyl-tRNA editing enzyme YbaK/EbsC (Cys-tRNA(Pro) deacylase)